MELRRPSEKGSGSEVRDEEWSRSSESAELCGESWEEWRELEGWNYQDTGKTVGGLEIVEKNKPEEES